jgi:tetratricopeptide (TPR) repeat protein
VVRPIAWFAVGVLGAFVLWVSPVSPWAISRGDVLAGEGDLERAITHFERVSRFNPWMDVRSEATTRRASLLRVGRDDPLRARLALRSLAEDASLDIHTRALAWEQLGQVLLDGFDDAEGAAAAFRMAYDTAPKDDRAADRLIAVARARESGRDLDEAHHAWDRVARKFPSRRAVARMNQASLLLGRGRVSQALELYEDAMEADGSAEVLAVAELGAKTCRDRLGRIEAALAERDASDLSDRIEQIRADQLRELERP